MKNNTTKDYRDYLVSDSWKLLRQEVFKRDEYECQICGEKGCYLEPHHIKPKSKYPKLIYDINNGITYCIECHTKNDEQRERFRNKI